MVAHLLPKQRVAGSNPVSRSNSTNFGMLDRFRVPFLCLFATRLVPGPLLGVNCWPLPQLS